MAIVLDNDDAVTLTADFTIEGSSGHAGDLDAAAPQVMERVRPPLWRMALGLGAGLAAGVGVVLVVNPRIASQVIDTGRVPMDPSFLLLALACIAIAIVADAWSLLLLTQVFVPGVRRKLVVSTALEAHLVGGATLLGGFEIPYQVFFLRRAGLSGWAATSVVVFKGLVHTLLLAVVALGALVPWVDLPITPLQRRLVAGALCGVLALSALAWLWMRRPSGKALLPRKLHTIFDRLAEAAQVVRAASRRRLLGLLALQVAYWVAMFAVLLCALHALGWRGPIVPIVTGQAVTQVVMPVSLLPGGAGVAELSFLALIGPTLAPSLRVSSLVLWRVFTWVVPVALGALSLGLRGARHED